MPDGSPVFVIPHWTSDLSLSRRHLERAVRGILEQTDGDWSAVIVDDASPDPQVKPYLHELGNAHPPIEVLFRARNAGAGVARNDGVAWARDQGAPFVLFLDADDISYPTRLESVRAAFERYPVAGVVYSTFRVVDANDDEVQPERMIASVAEVLDAHRQGPPQGMDAWIAIGTETGYVNHTSSTAVRCDVASAHAFPAERVSEDAHTWLRYSGGGAYFAYLDEPLSAYRVTPSVEGSSSRTREGGKEGFYAGKARVDASGFGAAIELALGRGAITADHVPDLWVRFRVRLAETLGKEGLPHLAAAQVRAAREVSLGRTREWIWERGLTGQSWSTGEA